MLMEMDYGRGLHVARGRSIDIAAYDGYIGRWSRLFVPAVLKAAEVVRGCHRGEAGGDGRGAAAARAAGGDALPPGVLGRSEEGAHGAHRRDELGDVGLAEDGGTFFSEARDRCRVDGRPLVPEPGRGPGPAHSRDLVALLGADAYAGEAAVATRPGGAVDVDVGVEARVQARDPVEVLGGDRLGVEPARVDPACDLDGVKPGELGIGHEPYCCASDADQVDRQPGGRRPARA